MGSLSLIIVLIIVVWVIVLAPIVMGNNKPIRHSGDGFDATRVLHSGAEPVAQRRRPKLTPADVHRHSGDEEGFKEVEAVEVERAVEPREETAPAAGGSTAVSVLDGEVVEEAGGSTALSVLREDEHEGEPAEPAEPYAIDESYGSPEDFGFEVSQGTAGTEANAVATEDAEATVDTVDTVEAVDTRDTADAANTADTADAAAEEHDAHDELTEEDVAFAKNRLGRGGWDPERERAARQDRFRRRQRTLLGLIVADVVAFVAAFVAGGWVWVAPAVTIALTVWFMAALRSVVRAERALHARRVRQLRRSRLGVASAGAGAQRRRPGAVIVELDDDSPDFAQLGYHREAPVSYGYAS
ncbi:gephyrin-like molybdotransferase receptor GlpR [Corynebacterium liangguodongii]|uniref:Uncharacterized protein n=1 Tax=Corynebacterium liangguodongii TaxID=2079535 RepID=A0A2S0WD36_9CORY|nr:gephyrin-like molybdotransferase receptor GlpR [Corynebacterium liangguodongii]AWB83676.1 hypothetical protein C3E79_03565 [Corynebacterium liangguodongii]PWB99514.1 hypothetical protein DF219_06230 [Corynebacterium liangguodongii]